MAVTILCCLPFSAISATSVKDVWVSMPDSIAPYLNQKLRIECADLYEMGAKAEVQNLLKRTSKIETWAANYLQAQLSDACQLQLCILPCTEGDSLICMIKTFAGPEKESSVQMYSMQWQLLQTMSFSFKIQRDVIIAKHFIDKQRTLKWQNYFESTIPIDPPCYYQGHFFIQKINSRGKSQNRAIVFSNKVIIDIL